jgi:hypothetical protein
MKAAMMSRSSLVIRVSCPPPSGAAGSFPSRRRGDPGARLQLALPPPCRKWARVLYVAAH